MDRMANQVWFWRGCRIVAAAALLGVISCGGGGGGETGGSGGHAGAAGGKGGSSNGGKGGSNTGGTGGGQTATGGSAGGTGGTAGTGSGGSAGQGGDGGGIIGGAAGMDAGVGGSAGAVDAGMDASADAGNGAPCTAASQCPSGFCVDGVCCEAACTGSCSACSNAKTGQADGLCRPIPAGMDPDDECAAQDPSTCGLDGVCNGAGACRKWGANTTCAAESCTGSTDTPARTCNGSGTCQAATNASCGNYVCGATSCKTSCTTGTDCASGAVCSGGHCVAPQANGTHCGGAGDCASGFCVDGVCCESACAGMCAACTNAKTGQADGLCKPITAGSDPDSECADDGAASCGHDGTCDGAGACRLYGATTVCAGASCNGALEAPARMCDGAGTCVAASTMSCGSYMCGATTCMTSCTQNTDCASGYFCSAGSCVMLEAPGTACVHASDCASGNCVDGVCCQTACTGACMTCNGAGTAGTCTPAAAGTDARSDCNADAPSTCGHDGTCDGAGACRLYSNTTACSTGSCTGSTLTAASMCDGAGTCVAGGTSSCNAYQCNAGGTACATTCTSDANCGTGYFCAAGSCYATSAVNLAGNGDVEYGTTTGWSTNGGQTLVVENGATTAGLSHGGTYSIADTALTANYQGPGYVMPTGAGKYNVSVWAMQNDNPTQTAAVQVNLPCGSTNNYPVIGSYGFSMAQGVWTHITGTIDLSAQSGCDPTAATPGVVNSALLYLNQTATGTPTALPNLFFDDLTIQVTDGHNLVGNPNFEANSPAGWTNNGGGSLAGSLVVANSGTHSLALTGRTATYNGPVWKMPIGIAKYNVTFNALQKGTANHPLVLAYTYTCVGGSAQYGTIAQAASVAPNTWTALTGSVTFPPAGAPSICKLGAAAVYLQQGDSGTCTSVTGGTLECPDLYIDDVSVTLAP